LRVRFFRNLFGQASKMMLGTTSEGAQRRVGARQFWTARSVASLRRESLVGAWISWGFCKLYSARRLLRRGISYCSLRCSIISSVCCRCIFGALSMPVSHHPRRLMVVQLFPNSVDWFQLHISMYVGKGGLYINFLNVLTSSLLRPMSGVIIIWLQWNCLSTIAVFDNSALSSV